MHDTPDYVTDLDGYSGPVDRISPYHFYQHTYWNLRGRWRRALYDWTRREPCDATASITPELTVAGNRETLILSLKAGPTPVREGARIAVYFPLDIGGYAQRNSLPCFQGPNGQTGYGARIVAQTSVDGCELATLVHSTGSVFTCVEITVVRGLLNRDQGMDLVIGHPDCKPPLVGEKAKAYPFRVAVDYAGDGTFRPVTPNPQVVNAGNRAAYLRCFAPATPGEGVPFGVRVVAADLLNHNPAYFHASTLRIRAGRGPAVAASEHEFPQACHGSTVIGGVTVATGEVTRLEVVDESNGLMGMTNPICPAAAPEGMRLYYGEIHSHTEISDGGGLPQDSFRWARDVEGLDFAALADHFEDGQSYNYTLEDKWRITKEVTDEYDAPGSFVTLLGYEIGTLEAHRNVYFRDSVGRMIVEGPQGERVTMDNVFAKLDGTEYLLIPHAPKFHGINWHRPMRPDRQRLVEICSNWGVSEEGGLRSVRHALDLGYQLGFTGGTDNHCAEAGNPDLGGITGVYAHELSREGIFDALLARRSFATNGPRMILTFSVDGCFMGEDTTAEHPSPRQVRGRAITCEPVERIDIVGNGEVVYSMEGKGREDIAIAWEDDRPLHEVTPVRELAAQRFAYYYLRVRTVNGGLGWSSPVWVRTAPRGMHTAPTGMPAP